MNNKALAKTLISLMGDSLPTTIESKIFDKDTMAFQILTHKSDLTTGKGTCFYKYATPDGPSSQHQLS